MSITIIGLGPGDPELLTRRAWDTLAKSSEVYLRTSRHPGVEALPIANYQSFDALYDQATDFVSLYKQIAEQVVQLGERPQGVIYAVPGHPLVGESTVTQILDLARAKQLSVSIIDGLSFIEPTLAAIGLDGMEGLQLHDAATIAHMHHPPLNPDLPVVLAQLYSRAVASDVKLTLLNQYPDDHPVRLIHGAGTVGQAVEVIPLFELDRSRQISHLTSLYLPPLTHAGSFERFQEVIAHLRAPEGCPWDRKQTHASLRKYLIEETYETIEAIDNDDAESLAEELGDVLLQVVLHTQIATEAGDFRMADVLNNVIDKMIRRHPHVWGEVQADTAEQVKLNWEALKRQEKAARGEPPQAASVFDGVPPGLPALAQASSYHERAARTGFDWSTLEEVLGKLNEEVAELIAAQTDAERQDEFGDVLTTLVNVARWLKLDPETALRNSNTKFKRRFQFIEQHAEAPVNTLTLEQMEALWAQAKAAERSQS